MPKVKKQLVREQLALIDIEGRLDHILSNLQTIQKQYMDKGYHSDRLDVTKNYYGFDGAYDLCLYGTRLETDQEYKSRLSLQRKMRETKQEKKAKRIAELKKELAKLEGNNNE